ncbi:type II secretion system major pseudopilin GspG [Pelomonas sp. V22]|uniref:type II secretion system major pseudopilin GspG n=1 Tax=Pelomonas sp. V22 TaxID=2822139 RepID=UPI0024A95D63|nr:type II secretion system major pseudopilin GspG [Pelomonas sp. V22]
MRRQRTSGFTLIEMLVVMVIIGLLAGIVGPRLFSRVDTSKVQTAKTQIKSLSTSLGILQIDIGMLPTASEGLNLLVEPPANEPQRSLWRGPYLTGKLPLDPWGRPYIYKVPGEAGQPYTIMSLGADGKEGGEGINADVSL